MKIIINESQLKTIHNSLNEAALPSFSLEELTNIQSFKGKQQYCIQNLGKPIGNGSSRQVFQIDDNKVLKLAKNTKGIKQNEYEGTDDYYKSSLSIFPEVFEHDENYTWIVSEYVLPAKEQDFKHCFGMSFDEWRSVIKAMEIAHKGGRQRYLDFIRPMESKKVWELCDKNETIADFNDYIGSYSVGIGDFYTINNYGLALRGNQPQIVILDSGLSEDIYNSYYKRD